MKVLIINEPVKRFHQKMADAQNAKAWWACPPTLSFRRAGLRGDDKIKTEEERRIVKRN